MAMITEGLERCPVCHELMVYEGERDGKPVFLCFDHGEQTPAKNHTTPAVSASNSARQHQVAPASANEHQIASNSADKTKVKSKVATELITEAATEASKEGYAAVREHAAQFRRDLPAMATDLLELGNKGFLAKWPNLKSQAISRIKSSPVYKNLAGSMADTPAKKHHYPARRKPASKPDAQTQPGNNIKLLNTPAAESGNGRLPPFPAFSDAWPVLTQLEWLKTYRELGGGK
jgi:hypothetical protein